MSSITVIQARTGSSRFPAKVLLPVAGMPLVVLAAKRAANTGRTVLVATSVENEDNMLAELLKNYGIQFYRGSLQNTLERVVNSVMKYDDDTIFIRLTADNVFPDGHLIDEIENEFRARSLDYLCCNGIHSGLPYGMSVEIMWLKHLREAITKTSNELDQEHVTPYIIRKFGATYFEKYKSFGKGHYRCTVDLYEDYINICKVFVNIDNPISVLGISLINKLEKLTFQPIDNKPVPQLVFGAAQLGMVYGITNTCGQPSTSQAEHMLKIAINNGVEYVDTARAYGDSEKVIGQSLIRGWQERVKIITKLSPLSDCPEKSEMAFIKAKVDMSIYKSCTHLGQNSIDVLMLHRVAHFTAWNGAAWNRLVELQKEGVIKTLGVSVQNPKELEIALNIEYVNFIQMPFNILDWRWDKFQRKILTVKKDRQLIVHARSVLLQGLLVSTVKKLWSQAHISDPSMIFDWLQRQAKINGYSDVVDLCLAYVRSKSWIDGVALGMETNEQLEKNIHSFNLPLLQSDHLISIEKERPNVSGKTLDPSCWHRS